MSNYLPFQEEQPFESATFKIDSPSKTRNDSYPDDYNQNYILKNPKSPQKKEEVTKRSAPQHHQNQIIAHTEKSMHHQEIRLNRYLNSFIFIILIKNKTN